jgi:hypothetical protein
MKGSRNFESELKIWHRSNSVFQIPGTQYKIIDFPFLPWTFRSGLFIPELFSPTTPQAYLKKSDIVELAEQTGF